MTVGRGLLRSCSAGRSWSAPASRSARPPPTAGSRHGVEFLPRYDFHLHGRAPVAATTRGSSGTPTSAASSTSSTTGADAAHVRRELPGDARRGVPRLRSEPGQLHPGGVGCRRASAASRWPASSITSRATSATAPSVPPVDWNMLGGRVGTHGRARPGARGRRASTCAASSQQAFVDYAWELDTGAARSTGMLRPRVGVSSAAVAARTRRGRIAESRQADRVSRRRRRAVSRARAGRSSCSWPSSGGSTRIRSSSAPPRWASVGYAAA